MKIGQFVSFMADPSVDTGTPALILKVIDVNTLNLCVFRQDGSQITLLGVVQDATMLTPNTWSVIA